MWAATRWVLDPGGIDGYRGLVVLGRAVVSRLVWSWREVDSCDERALEWRPNALLAHPLAPSSWFRWRSSMPPLAAVLVPRARCRGRFEHKRPPKDPSRFTLAGTCTRSSAPDRVSWPHAICCRRCWQLERRWCKQLTTLSAVLIRCVEPPMLLKDLLTSSRRNRHVTPQH